MPVIQELDGRQIDECLDEVTRRQAPIAVTYRAGLRWFSHHSRILRSTGDRLWLDYPTGEKDQAPQITDGLALGLSFKIKHHKHVFSAVVVGTGWFRRRAEAADAAEDQSQSDGETEIRAFCVLKPQRMQRIQRRAYNRVGVPRNRSVLATFWQGGVAGQPVDHPSDAPLSWEGWVTNISAGGFQVRTASQGTPRLEAGDILGVRIELGQEFEPVVADAQLRHQSTDDRGVKLMGFQFVGLNDSEEGRETLRLVSKVVCAFQRLHGRRRADTVA